MKSKKINLFLEKAWLIITILYLLFVIYIFFVDGKDVAKFYLLFSILPIAMWMVRRVIRKKMEKPKNG